MGNAYKIAEAMLTGKFKVPTEQIRAEVTLDALGLDSLAVVELLYTLETESGVRIGEDEIGPQSTLSELLSIMDANLVPRAAEGTPTA